ncbi:MAG: urease accessory UreF family protein [Rubrivivax sp.]
MPTDAATIAPARAAGSTLLQLIWLASPALPVGAFSYSEGLEAAIDSGRVVDEKGARTWLLDQLTLSQARCDLAVAGAAIAAWRGPDLPRIVQLNDWLRCTRESAEFRLQTEQAGRSMADWLRQRHPDDPRAGALRALAPAPTWPLAFALAAVHSGAEPEDALLAMAFGWAENMVQAAVKAVPLGQSAGQRLLGALADAIPDAVADALRRDTESARQSFTPMLAIVSAQHETQYSRLFRS